MTKDFRKDKSHRIDCPKAYLDPQLPCVCKQFDALEVMARKIVTSQKD